MAEMWQELDVLIAAVRSAHNEVGMHQSGYQNWVRNGLSDKEWREVDENLGAAAARAEQTLNEFLAANRGTRLKPPLLSRRKLQTPWSTLKTYLR